ncbi:hypothetical protein L7F22_039544 [Adiantum nelumboides]|nr:hypothetical protein [Adiantum nelumboides]
MTAVVSFTSSACFSPFSFQLNTEREPVSCSHPYSRNRHRKHFPNFLCPRRRSSCFSNKHSSIHTQRILFKCCSIPSLQYNGHVPLTGTGDGDGEAESNSDQPSLVNPYRPPRPTRIILVRHGQSEGNVDETAYTRIPDNQISMTETGWKQALKCGQAIRKLIESDGVDDWSVYFYVSPYKRALQTLRGIGRAFDRHHIAGVREEPRIREQDFGNFQDREKMRQEKEKRARYSRFFYRFPDGESAADVYDRLTGFRETLRSDIDLGRFQRPEVRSKNMNLVIVSHGLTLRLFLMRWYKWTVTQFEAINNFPNAGLLVMQLGTNGRYSLRVHHTRQELEALGLTIEMIQDQEWQKDAMIGDLNYDWITSGPSFFTHFDLNDKGATIPPDIIRTRSNVV